MKYSIEHTREWCGVLIPEWIRVFDCRASHEEIFGPSSLAPWGVRLWGSERAEVDMGLRGPDWSHATHPLSCQTYIDARTAGEKELTRQLRNAVVDAERLRKEYLEAKEVPSVPEKGGSCLYLPVAITISNFGWGIVSDERTRVVRNF